ncbi:MAG TPA: hypothetical protein VFD39_08860 [Trueperaceae bacterium]|nr:hypothetical protein [Trueperaceae bacterium]
MPIAHVCVTCGAHLPGGSPPPALCPICDEPRQYVPLDGQRWLSYADLAASHANRIEEVEVDLWGVGVEPTFAIGQRALLVRTEEGNLLWDCVPLLTPGAIARLEELGGVRAVAVSHPHFYTGAARFAAAFGAEVILHDADCRHVAEPGPHLRFWTGETLSPFGDLTLVRAGGHFAGGTVLHWPAGAGGRGELLTGDIVRVIPDRSHVAFLYSYPNLIPLPGREVERIAAAVARFRYDRIHDGWWGRVIEEGAEAVMERSVARYVRALAGRLDGVQLPWPAS